MNRFANASLLVVFAVAVRARADFHDWRINEVFSDASGRVQFIEFHNTLEDGEEFLSGHVLSTNGGSFTFSSDLPSDQTVNKFFLVATDDFAALPGAPTPDYTIPPNFINPAGDHIDYTGVDAFTFAALPTDGELSLNRDLTSDTNSPTNFAGQSGSVRVGPPSGIPLPAAAIPAALTIAGCAVPALRRQLQPRH
jgi:serralysin